MGADNIWYQLGLRVLFRPFGKQVVTSNTKVLVVEDASPDLAAQNKKMRFKLMAISVYVVQALQFSFLGVLATILH